MAEITRKRFYVYALVLLIPLGLVGLYLLLNPKKHIVAVLWMAALLLPVGLGVLLLYFPAFRAKGRILGALKVKWLRRSFSIALFIFMGPFIASILLWSTLGAAFRGEGFDQQMVSNMKERPGRYFFLCLGPPVILSYLFVAVGHVWASVYCSSIAITLATSSAIWGLRRKGGTLAFFGPELFRSSPAGMGVLTLVVVAAFGSLHYALWSFKHAEYGNLNGWQDALYFSITTMATVGYGDIIPLGRGAKWLCACEIVVGFTLLVVAVNAAISVWLQVNQAGGSIAPVRESKKET